MAAEFDCQDCGWHVINFAGYRNGRGRCLVCDWLAENVADATERERLRGFMVPRTLDSTPPRSAVSFEVPPPG